MSPVKQAFNKARDWYGRWEKPISSLSLFGGFAFDAITLRRVDMLWENFWIIVHLVVVAACIVLINTEKEENAIYDPEHAHFWYINVLQFFFGGLLSVFLVFYFRSSSIASSWPFLLVLAIAFMANERLKKQFEVAIFQISLLFLSVYCFAIYALPVLVHRIGPLVFLASGLLSLALILAFSSVLLGHSRFRKSREPLAISIILIFGLMNIFYFTNIIPPIPLSLKDAGVYHSITKDPQGKYLVTSEDQGFWGFLSYYDGFHAGYSEPVYVLSAVFSPTDLNTDIVHEWQYYDESAKNWVTASRITVAVMGGREDGYHTYTERDGLAPGKWRVNVETPQGQIIGTIRFKVESGSPQALETEVK